MEKSKNFKSLADAFNHYRSEGHSVEEAIKMSYKHRDLVEKWVEKMRQVVGAA